MSAGFRYRRGMGSGEVDKDAALEVLRSFSVAVFEQRQFSTAIRFFTRESQHDWAHEWVVGELEDSNVGAGDIDLLWSEKDEVVSSLSSMDAGYPLWSKYAADTLRVWQDIWQTLPDALEGRGTVNVGRYRTPEEWASMPGQVTVTVGRRVRKGPPVYRVYFDLTESGWLIADINAA